MSFIGPTGKTPSRYFWTIQGLVPAAHIATATTASFDRYRNGGYAALTLELWPGLWTDGNHSWVINESDDNSTWSLVVTAYLMHYPEVVVYCTASTFVAVNASSTVLHP